MKVWSKLKSFIPLFFPKLLYRSQLTQTL